MRFGDGVFVATHSLEETFTKSCVKKAAKYYFRVLCFRIYYRKQETRLHRLYISTGIYSCLFSNFQFDDLTDGAHHLHMVRCD
mmetsp:Transcript_37693/g.91556  ORF Transcript_37693/g.91556 Transcript_37693/m.91556 type:complete len:83 (-) Transcript_37693:96-344(-)